MGKSNQASALKFFLWISGPASTWYICKTTFPHLHCLEVFAFTEAVWIDKIYYYRGNKNMFLRDHVEISEEEAVKCILAGPEYCYDKQLEVLSGTRT